VQTVSSQFEAELKKTLADEIERIRTVLEAGMAVKDFADYRYHVGQVHAIRRVIDAYCDEVSTKLSKR
jgi:hypothetical protein